MRKELVMLLVSLILIAPTQAFAATDAGIKPGNIFYFLDTTFEKISLFFTFNPGEKAAKALEYADERLAEIEAIAEEKNSDAVKTTIADYESNIALATEKSKEVKDKKQAEDLFTLIEDSASKNQEILSAVLSKVPEEAKEAITRAVEASKKGQEEAAKQIARFKDEIEQLKKEVAELKDEKAKPQIDEVERLKKEVEELKKQQSPAQPVQQGSAPAIQQQERKTPGSVTTNNETQKLVEERERQERLEDTRLEELRHQQEIEANKTLRESARQQRLAELQKRRIEISNTAFLVRQKKDELESLYQSKIALLNSQEETEAANLETLYQRTLSSIRDDYGSRGLGFSGMRIKAEEDLLVAYNSDKLNITDYYDKATDVLVSEKNLKLLDLDVQIGNLEGELNSINKGLSQ